MYKLKPNHKIIITHTLEYCDICCNGETIEQVAEKIMKYHQQPETQYLNQCVNIIFIDDKGADCGFQWLHTKNGIVALENKGVNAESIAEYLLSQTLNHDKRSTIIYDRYDDCDECDDRYSKPFFDSHCCVCGQKN